jgi:hypothetical protein
VEPETNENSWQESDQPYDTIDADLRKPPTKAKAQATQSQLANNAIPDISWEESKHEQVIEGKMDKVYNVGISMYQGARNSMKKVMQTFQQDVEMRDEGSSN